MKTRTHKSCFPLLTSAVIALMLLGLAGAARIMGWVPNSIGDFDNVFTTVHATAFAKPVAEGLDVDLAQAPDSARGKRRCPECGVIVSMREIGATGPNGSLDTVGQERESNQNGTGRTSTRSYEFSVRLAGGARRVIIDANPASWRLGERVIVIDGKSASHQ